MAPVVGNISNLGPGTMLAVELDGERIAVANVEGSLFAFSNACTHRQCPLSDGTSTRRSLPAHVTKASLM